MSDHTHVQHTLSFGPPQSDTRPDGTATAVTVPLAPPSYRIESELGRGGMGVVYKAVQTGLGRTVALKTILSGEHAGAKDLIRFLAEAESVAAVRHPHVVQVFEYGEHAGRPFMALEFCPNGSLADRLKAAGPLPAREAAALVAKLAAAVQAAHDRGIVHRDLKPGNVLFGEGGEPKVADFGLAKRGTADLTHTGAILGTPAYMAPEQAAGRTKFVGPAADVYALGVILYECLTGRVPFSAGDTLSLIRMVVDDDPPPPRRLAPRIPRVLEKVALRCLAKAPHERYQSAGELAADLDRVAAGEPPRHLASGRLAGVLGALGRGRQAADLARYSRLFVGLAALMFLTHAATGLVNYGLMPEAAGTAAFLLRLVGVPLLVVVARRGDIWPDTLSERVLWSVWGGYLLGCGVAGVQQKLAEAAGQPVHSLYPQFALMAAVAFFALAPSFWGWCFVFGGGFLALPVLMDLAPPAGPFLFGSYWAAVLLLMSLHLRRLAALSAAPPSGGGP